MFLLGWAAYFRFGTSTRNFDKIGSYARMRMAGFLAKRHRRSRGFGWSSLPRAAGTWPVPPPVGRTASRSASAVTPAPAIAELADRPRPMPVATAAPTGH